MSSNLVITIGREYGSGGRAIAKRLSEIMNIKMYDKELITIAAKNFGLSEEFLHDIDETASNSFLYALSTGSYSHNATMLAGPHSLPLTDKAFIACSQVIKNLAESESCIIVGRCADSVLASHENLFTVFIHADIKERAKRISEFEKISLNNAINIIKKEDRKRAYYHNNYSETKWGNSKSYDLCINSRVGIDTAAELIKFAVSNK